MEKNNEIFKTGDEVTWGNEWAATLTDGRKKYGDGPFLITSTKRVPKGTVGVGHAQWVTVATLNGTVEIGFFSGVFFKKV